MTSHFNPLEITVDTREQRPWAFPPGAAVVVRLGLNAGDYALTGDPGFAIERKCLEDFVGTVGSGWDRFQREIERMDGYPVKLIIVEGTDGDVVAGEYNHPLLTPAFVTKRIVELQWSGVHVYFAGNPYRAAQIAFLHLLQRRRELDGNSDCSSQTDNLPEA